jgi:hypothetical protein
MYTENTIFCDLFQSNFTRSVCDQLIPKQKSSAIWALWEQCNRDPTIFLPQINFYDKMEIHHWFMVNIILFINKAKIQIPNITSFSLTKPLCDEIFPKCSNIVWNIWVNHANEDPVKFISLINVKYKLCMILWQKNN